MSVMSLFARVPSPQPMRQVETGSIEGPTEEYQQLAAKLGLRVAALEPVGTLEEILRSEFIPIYAMKSVAKYMDRITPPRKYWKWMPVRQEDIKRCKGFVTFHQINSSGVVGTELYDKPIPLPALITMDKIEDACKGAGVLPAFFVSDYVARVPDPFLMVTIPSRETQEQEPAGRLWVMNPEPACFVVERWDEPSYRE